MKFDWDWQAINDESEFHYTKRFIDYLWKYFKKAFIIKYMDYKKKRKEPVYLQIGKFLNSKLYNCFGILHNVVFNHFLPKDNRKKLTFRNKDLFILVTLNSLLLAINSKIRLFKKIN